MPFLAVPSLLSRLFVALLALLLLPLTALLSAAPAHATPGIADGAVYDALGDPLEAVTVEALAAPAYSTVAASTTTDATGAYALPLTEGTYHLRYTKTGFSTAFYDGDTALDVVVDDVGDLTVDGEPVEGNLLYDMTLASTPFAVTGVVETAGGVGIVGITVRAFPEGSTDPGEVVDTATSAAAGSYTLDLPIGSYDLEFVDNDGSGPTYTTTALAQVRVAQGGVLSVAGSQVDGLPDVAMAVSSADTPHPVTGSVVDVNGDEVDGLTVSAVPQGETPGANATSDATGADGGLGDHGRYRLMLKPGTYQLEVEGGADWADTTYVGEGAGTALVTVQLNGTVLVNGVEAVGGELGSTEVVGTTSYGFGGEVSDGTTGLVGITVTVFHEGDTSTTVATTTSTAGGAYSVSGLKVGSYVVRFTDNVADGTNYVQTFLGGPPTGSPVKVGQGGVLSYGGSTVTSLPDVVMAVPPPDATYDVTGAVLDAIGEPIAGIPVHAAPTGATPVDQVADTTSGAEGTYLLQLEAGTYTISFEGGTHFADATYNGDGESAATIQVTEQGLVLVNGTEAVGGELDPVSLIGTTNYPVSGEVTNGSAALPGITVAVYTEGSTEPGTELVTATTSGTGGYAFELPVGSYVLRYSGSSGGSLYTARWFGTGPAPGTPVQVGQNGAISVDGETVPVLADVVMTVAGAGDPHALPGDVVDNNYDPLPGVLVTAVAAGGGAVTDTATSDSEGHFQLDLVPGSYQVKYEKSGYPLTWYPDPDTEGATATIVVALDGTITAGETTLTEGLDAQVLANPATKHPVSGTVVDEALAGLSGITVQALVEGTSTVAATATSTGGGAYTLQVPVGTYEIKFTDNDVALPTYVVTYFGGAPPTPVKVATGGQVSVDDVNVASLPPVTMTEAAEDVRYDLKGALYDEVYDPLNGATVKVVPVEGTPAEYAETVTTELEPGDVVINYRIPVRPGKYQLEYSLEGYQTVWLAYYETPAKRVTVTVAANGSITAPGLELVGGVIDDMQLLLQAPAMVTAPKLTGKVVVGQVVTATVGTWNPDIPVLYPDWQDSTYVEWFLDGKSAGRFSSGYYGQKFKLTTAAATKKLSFRVSIDDPNGERASAVYTSPAVTVPKAPSALKATYRARKLTATLTVPTLRTPTGKITVFDGKKKVGMGTLVAKSKGVIVISIAKLKRGRHTLTVKYAGTAIIAKSKKVLRIRV